ncbi:MAG: cobyric acid synthase [Nitrospinota bacterium]
MAKTIMIQGTGSHVGKSVVATGLCRALMHAGYRVAPFKAQNMALNSFATESGGEIGVAQAAQAEACGVTPVVEMNPVLLKPNSDTGSQVILCGKVFGNMSVDEYMGFKPKAREVVKRALAGLKEKFDIIVIEGAGSPAEINLRENDIANMGTAEIADSPVLLVGDIDRGGVFASLYGTFQLLLPWEKKRVQGFIINKFRGQRSLLDSGIKELERLCQRPVLGVLPYLHDIAIAEEDSLGLPNGNGRQYPGAALDIGVVRLPSISNFTDFDPLASEQGVKVRYIKDPSEFGAPDIVILPGSKSTIHDMSFLRRTGLSEKITSAAQTEKEVVGICGGFQMLGKKICDPDSHESALTEIEGLGLLSVNTTIKKCKETFQVKGVELETGISVRGYEIHMGESRGEGKPVFSLTRLGGSGPSVQDGERKGNVWGTYIHGLFENDAFRNLFLNKVRKRKGVAVSESRSIFDRGPGYDALAHKMTENLDMAKLYSILSLP